MTRYGQDTAEDLCKPLKIPIMRSFGLGCRGAAAEIKPIEPVWVMPAKGAAS